MQQTALGFSLLFVLAILLSGCQKSEPPQKDMVRPVRAMKVGDVAELERRSFPGRAQAAQEVNLSFRVTGPLVARPVSVGDEIKTGDLVARIDPRDFEVRVREAEGNLQRARANEQRARNDYQRNLNIQQQDPGAISEAVIDRSREALDLAKADIAALEASLDAAKDALDYTQLQAPFDGTIVATFVENFQFVQARQPIVRLVDNTRIEFVVNIPETLISLTSYVQDIWVQFDAFRGVKIPAEISEIGTEASETTRTFPVTLIMDQPDDIQVLPGMAGSVSGKVQQLSDTEQPQIVIPVTAVVSTSGGDKNHVWVIDESTNTVSQREVEIEALVNAGLVIKQGLAPGEVIATAGVHFLAEGQQVRLAMQ